MQIDKEKINEIVNIGKKYKVDSIGLFGSRARGEGMEYSDYDIFIIGDIKFDEELYLEGELEEIIDGEVDLIKLDDEVDKILAKNILNDAKVFVNKNNSFEKFYSYIDNFFIENHDFLKRREWDLLDK